ncbi:hypothetical protein K432DRAFT_376726 [Lepidopterella palustris CBS 459.81]|uniref:Large ribosomal subunit protein uL23m n=1 Tax=Lepidopterella palustris CBS 459.81 TaxID=1314670 RepID=A0A8E2ELV7_9PEZI|nr:hypothetical protein K432DRAFT_376726 [Lepidopterella palustris CBS 459.81]
MPLPRSRQSGRVIRFGRKELYLPRAVIALTHTPWLPPTQAKFVVPLSFNKLDLRDYLYHVYGVKTMNIRTYIQQQKVQEGKKGELLPGARQWHRPRAIKKMTVEMETPFVWPAQPENWDAWSKDIFSEVSKSYNQTQDQQIEDRKESQKKEADTLEQQAKDLLTGKKKWRPTWVDYGDEKEVERDIKL